MKDIRKPLALALLAALLCALPVTGALAWKIKAGTVTQGAFSGSGVTFQAPEGFTLYEIHRTDDMDRVILHGPRDKSRYFPAVYVFLHR
ncbi:MAG TPA: hypothetical protein VLA21_09720, partial [Candidatus Limnocylindria bacterium]|nr:hypothetical protein [Candidatus Limnocylindria bacterium]